MRSSRVLGPLALVVTLGVACPPAAAGWAAGMTSVTGNSTSATNPVVDISATPSGWISVAYGDAQVAVPPNWRVMTHAWCGGGPPIIQLGNVINNLLCLTGPMPPKVTITPLVSVPARYRHEQQTTLNGIPVLRAPRAGTTISAYFVPSLHVTVSATSALGERVVESLTASPRSVVLAPGTAPAIPSSWQRLRFQGLTFATPGKWPVLYTLSDYPFGWICGGTTLNHGPLPVVNLSYDKSLATMCWGLQSQLLTPQTPQDGLQIDSGPRTLSLDPVKPSFSEDCLSIHGLKVCPATSPAYSILVLKVNVSGRSKPVIVSIGLAGSGMVARTILYSLRKA
jgi:hypothetical protein